MRLMPRERPKLRHPRRAARGLNIIARYDAQSQRGCNRILETVARDQPREIDRVMLLYKEPREIATSPVANRRKSFHAETPQEA